jgi:hypothetical protein
VRHEGSPMRSTQRWARRLLVVGAMVAMTATMAAPAPASVAAPAAQTTSVLTAQERADLPAGARKVTRAGLVHGTIPAQAGDIVLAATVLHASKTNSFDIDNNGPPGNSAVHLRMQRAIEENTSNQVRGYWRFRLVYGPNDTTWSTYHQGVSLRVHREDRGTNQADGCLSFPLHCTWTTDPSDCRGPSPPCGYYIRSGTYRAKGDAQDWWLTEFKEYRVWHPNTNRWEPIYNPGCSDQWWHQGLWWQVRGSGRAHIACPEVVGE